jgi:hypothetical protein
MRFSHPRPNRLSNNLLELVTISDAITSCLSQRLLNSGQDVIKNMIFLGVRTSPNGRALYQLTSFLVYNGKN